jgi:hypothetical protein
MNWAHFHLIVNEIPILGAMLTVVFFAIALFGGNRDAWARAGMVTLAVSVVGMLLAFFSGTPAMHEIGGMAHTSHLALSEHHVRSLWSITLTSVADITWIVAAVVAWRRGGTYPRPMLSALLITTLLAAAALAITGNTGGRISHPELQGPTDKESGPTRPH